MTKIIVTGNGTNVGKTVVCAILAEALGASYWKPVECGEESDTETIRKWLPSSRVFSPSYSLKTPVSPHQAARLEKKEIVKEHIIPPVTAFPLIIETAGGILVPWHETFLAMEVLEQWEASWVVVSKHYLGSINHTLLTIENLIARRRKARLVIFNGTNLESEEAILHFSQLKSLQLPTLAEITQQTIKTYANQWKDKLQFLL